MKNLLFGSILSCIVSGVMAQVPDHSLIGKWEFTDTEHTRQLDEQAKSVLNAYHRDTYFYFIADGKYRSNTMHWNDQGTWSINAAGDSITLTSDFGDVRTIPVHMPEKDELQLVIEQGKGAMIYSRTKSSREDNSPIPLREIEMVSVPLDSLLGRWSLIRKHDPVKSAERMERINQMMIGSYFTFGADGSFIMKLGLEQGAGKWAMGADSATFMIDLPQVTQMWNIIDHSAGELTVVKGREATTYYFRKAQ